MPVLIGVPVLVFTLVLQTTAFSRLPLLYGTADIMLLVLLAWMLNENVKHGWEWVVMGGLMVSFVSALPLMIPLWSYSISAGLAFWLKKRIWQTPVLAMLVSAFFGTVIFHILSAIVLQFSGSEISLLESFSLIILPSVFWNLILAVPVHTFVSELADWLYPREVEI